MTPSVDFADGEPVEFFMGLKRHLEPFFQKESAMHKYRLSPFIQAAYVIFCFIQFSGPLVNTVQAAQRANSYPIKNLVQYANPMCGTGGNGETYPGAVAPFGMIQWSPDAGTRTIVGGYNYRCKSIWGFSLDHLSGAGCPYDENFAFMPILGAGLSAVPSSREAFAQPFSHSNEVARPGYYEVKLDNGIKVELTATTRSGFARITYPGTGPATMVVNASSNANGTFLSTIHLDPANRSVSGAAVGGHFCDYGGDLSTVYFYAAFSRPFKSYGTWGEGTLLKNDLNGNGRTAGAYLNFDMSGSRVVLVKVGLSYVSVTDARENLEAESPLSEFTSIAFDRAVSAASARWNRWLNRIQVTGGTKEEKRTFYSMLYHALLCPTVCSDVNGKYMGYDNNIHTARKGRLQYADFSGWDIYRSECQLLAMIAPKRAGDMAQSLLRDYQQGGAFPRWGVPNEDSGVMMGDPAAPIIAGIYAFGARDFDVRDAVAGLVRAATKPGVYAYRTQTVERNGLSDYLRLGYVPEHQKGGLGNVSMTLEYCTDDFAVSRLAEALGDRKVSSLLLKHAQNWKNLYNPQTGYIQMRRRDGSWAPGFVNDTDSYDHLGSNGVYVEGSAAQYTWMVPFNLKGLAEKMGGQEIAAARLDTFFTKLNAGVNSPYAYLGNEPCLETPWIYCFLGEPYKTQQVVRMAITQLFSPNPIGYPGNDDLGEMSSWYIFGALGMYPELPGSDVLVLGSPLFKKAVLHLSGGAVVILGKDAANDAPYVQSMSLNGASWNKPWIRFSDIIDGGTVIYKLSKTPNKKWGSAPKDEPPSFN